MPDDMLHKKYLRKKFGIDRELEYKILEFIAEKREATKYDIHKVLKIPYSKVYETFKRFKGKDKDLIEEKIGEKTRAGLYKKIYTLTPEGIIHVLCFSKLKSYSQVLTYLRRNREAIPLSEVLDKAIEIGNVNDVKSIAGVAFDVISCRKEILVAKKPDDYTDAFGMFLCEISDSLAQDPRFSFTPLIENEELRKTLIVAIINEIKKIATEETIKDAFFEVVNDFIINSKTQLSFFEEFRAKAISTLKGN